jgi:Ca2+-transporting ATPase
MDKIRFSFFNFLERLFKSQKYHFMPQDSVKKPFYQHSVSTVLEEFKIDQKTGLSDQIAKEKLAQNGKNSLTTRKIRSTLEVVWDQLKNPLILILLAVGLIKIFNLIPEFAAGKFSIQSVVEILMVFAVVLISTFIGTTQELDAEKSLEKLRSQVRFGTRVLRGGKVIEIDAEDVVLGDILVLESGDRVPADARVLESINGHTNEALLTGESEEITKNSEIIETDDLIPADQKNMIFAGTNVVGGKIIALVVATAQETEFGKISKELEGAEAEDTKFQKQTKELLKNLTIMSGVAFVLMEVLYILVLKLDPIISIETGLALVISFIPEALSAVTVIVLSISAASLVKKGIIVKNLASAEGMGSVSTFLTDKTGTITKGQMSMEELWFLDGATKAVDFKPHGNREKAVLEILKFCNNGKGATEEALTNFIKKYGLEVEFFDRKVEYGYNSETKRMTVVRQQKSEISGYSKGAGEVMLPMCKYYHDHITDQKLELTKELREKVLKQIEDYASVGLRVLLLAYRDYPQNHNFGDRKHDENELVFVGLTCLFDPLREEVFETVSKFKGAGIDLIMITGDHPNIAKYLAQKAGILEGDGEVITGFELEEYLQIGLKNLDSKITQKLINTKVFARVAPKHKDFLVEFFKLNGRIVAMAGDGVNDAVAIKKANIGIAVKNAVDWVRDIAGIVVTGGFDALIQAVEEGRKIIYRARLFSHYLLSGNISQVGIFILISLTAKNAPLTSLQLLVINLLTDTLPAVAMAYEEVPEEIMKQKPEPSSANLINKPIWASIIVQGVVTSIFLFWVFTSYQNKGLQYAQTMTFLAYLAQKLYRAFTARSFTKSIFEIGFFSNKITVYSVFGSLLIAGILAWPLAEFVGMKAVNLADFGLVAAVALIIPIVEEIFKFVRRKLEN